MRISPIRLVAVTVVLGLIAAATTVVLFVPGLRTHLIGGQAVTAPRPPVTPGAVSQMQPMPTLPTDRWRVDAPLLFGPQNDAHYLIVAAAKSDVVIVKSLASQENGPSPIAAASAEDGHVLWNGPSEFSVDSCSFSRDERLACVHTETRTIKFLDPRSGQVLSTQSIGIPGKLSVRRAGDGFLVKSQQYRGADSDSQLGLTWLSSDGSRQWSHTAPLKLDTLELSEAGNVVTVDNLSIGMQALELTTGRMLYDGADDARQGGEHIHIMLAPNAGGFAVGVRDYSDDKNSRVVLHDSWGAARLTLAGWRLGVLPRATEGDRIAAVHGNKVGVIDTSTNSVLWENDASTDDHLELVGGKYLLVDKSVAWGRWDWTIYDLTTGAETGAIANVTNMDYVGFDGQRIIFDSTNLDNKLRPTFTAFDPTGTQVWRMEINASLDDVNLRGFGPFLFRYDGRIGDSAAALARLASP